MQITSPDGGTMGVGSELERLFQWIAGGLTTTVTEYVASGV